MSPDHQYNKFIRGLTIPSRAFIEKKLRKYTERHIATEKQSFMNAISVFIFTRDCLFLFFPPAEYCFKALFCFGFNQTKINQTVFKGCCSFSGNWFQVEHDGPNSRMNFRNIRTGDVLLETHT